MPIDPPTPVTIYVRNVEHTPGLTGRVRYRIGWFGRIVLQVEEGGYGMWPHRRHVTYRRWWRDARPEDVMLGPVGVEVRDAGGIR